jgi:hypothetical protein
MFTICLIHQSPGYEILVQLSVSSHGELFPGSPQIPKSRDVQVFTENGIAFAYNLHSPPIHFKLSLDYL